MKNAKQRKIQLMMGLLLFVFGMVIGALAMWQFLNSTTLNIPQIFRFIFYIASALVLGGVLALSTKPILSLGSIIAKAIMRKFSHIKAFDIAGILLGIFTGVIIAFIIELILQTFLYIPSLRIIIDVVAGMTFSYILSIAYSNWLSAPEPEIIEKEITYKGYILTENALADERVMPLCQKWLDGNIFVLSSTADKISYSKNESAQAAYQNFLELSQQKAIKVLEFLCEDSENSRIMQAAAQKKLKIIASEQDSYLISSAKELSVLILGQL